MEAALRAAATSHGLYIPAGAFWGAEDILKMADRGTLKVIVDLYTGTSNLNALYLLVYFLRHQNVLKTRLSVMMKV